LNSEYEVARGIVGEVTLSELRFTLKNRKRSARMPKMMV
jgi:hypothetical protein